MKQFSDSASTTFSMLVDHEWYPTELELPPVISPRWPLLHQAVVLLQTDSCLLRREYGRSNLPEALHGCESPQPSEEEDDDGRGVAPQPKRARRCGKCGRAGHTRRTCQDK